MRNSALAATTKAAGTPESRRPKVQKDTQKESMQKHRAARKEDRASGKREKRYGDKSPLPARDIPGASELDRLESEGINIVKANKDSNKQPEVDSEGKTKMYLADGFSGNMTKLVDSEGNHYINTKSHHEVVDEKDPSKRSEKQQAMDRLSKVASKTVRRKHDPETGKRKADVEGGESSAKFLGKKSHSEKMDRIASKNQKKIDRITGKAKEDRKAARDANKAQRTERQTAKKAGRAAASQARATERLDKKSARAQGREDRKVARANKKIKKQEEKIQKAYDKNYKTMSKATDKYNA